MVDGADILAIRPLQDGDVQFVVCTWARSAHPAHWMGAKEFRENARLLARVTMGRIGATMLVSSEHEGTIMGWACAEYGAVHYAYFRPQLRASVTGRKWIDKTILVARGE